MTIQNRPIPSIQQVNNDLKPQKPATRTQATTGQSFADVFKQQLNQTESVRFSKHANMRLSSRQIELSDEQMVRLNQGVMKAQEKGIKESLMLMDNIALVVNVESNTVVTALDQNEATDKVFTNIDGAVLL